MWWIPHSLLHTHTPAPLKRHAHQRVRSCGLSSGCVATLHQCVLLSLNLTFVFLFLCSVAFTHWCVEAFFLHTFSFCVRSCIRILCSTFVSSCSSTAQILTHAPFSPIYCILSPSSVSPLCLTLLFFIRAHTHTHHSFSHSHPVLVQSSLLRTGPTRQVFVLPFPLSLFHTSPIMTIHTHNLYAFFFLTHAHSLPCLFTRIRSPFSCQ